MWRLWFGLAVLPTLLSDAQASRVAPFNNLPDQTGSPIFGSRLPPGGPSFAECFTAERALGPGLSFSRATPGTYIDTAGALTTASANAPRFDSTGGSAQGLLYEAQATNQLSSSNTFTSPWTATGSPTIGAGLTAPDGTASTLWTRTTASGSFLLLGFSKAARAENYVSSFTVRARAGVYFAVRMQGNYPARVDGIFNLSNGTFNVSQNTFTNVSGGMTPLGDGWYRISLYGTTDTSDNVAVTFSFNSDGAQVDGADSVPNSSGYVAEAQTELVSGQTTPTSYISTTSSSATRAADILSTPSGAASGPSLIESKDEATGSITRTARAAGSFAWPMNVWLRTVCVWPAGTPLSRIEAQTANIGAPCR